ncbi:hypothetical protein P5673_031278 [Acropora cervicornis]|uniref:Uncharacterized protein n=1 Tax=Acropora cervicornis TaxID=6130 RepID=A0AAD9PTB1_ACRCE|nr:hypothetical protein P5673_031278 [Acropora cervicornis]
MRVESSPGVMCSFQQDKDDKEMLVWLSERETKTRHGQEKGHQRAFQPKVYATKSERAQ